MRSIPETADWATMYHVVSVLVKNPMKLKNSAHSTQVNSAKAVTEP